MTHNHFAVLVMLTGILTDEWKEITDYEIAEFVKVNFNSFRMSYRKNFIEEGLISYEKGYGNRKPKYKLNFKP